VAVKAIRAALARGFRVTTNTTLFEGSNPERMRRFFDDMMELGVEGMMVSPGYSYEKAPDQEHFLRRERSHRLFGQMLGEPKRSWSFNQSPLFLQFLMGKRDFECTPWGNPTYNIFGWQRPCYLLQDGYAKSFRELMKRRNGRGTAARAATRAARTAWCTVGSSRARSARHSNRHGRWARPSPAW